MDPLIAAEARDRAGVVRRTDLGGQPFREARRARLLQVHPGAFVAASQPVDLAVHLAVLRDVWGDRDVYATGATALWLHGAGEQPALLVVGIPQSSELAARAPVEVRRLAKSVLDGARVRQGIKAVALEVAVIQIAAESQQSAVIDLVAELLRSRRTTIPRLRARCRRGFKGSAKVRAACDELLGGSLDADVRRLQAALERRGVSGLEVEVRFENRDGGSGYADLFHRPTKTAIEVDGRLRHSERAQFRVDRRRDRWLRRDHSVTTLRVDVGEIREDLDALADELVELLRDIARAQAEGDPGT